MSDPAATIREALEPLRPLFAELDDMGLSVTDERLDELHDAIVAAARAALTELEQQLADGFVNTEWLGLTQKLEAAERERDQLAAVVRDHWSPEQAEAIIARAALDRQEPA